MTGGKFPILTTCEVIKILKKTDFKNTRKSNRRQEKIVGASFEDLEVRKKSFRLAEREL